MARHCSRRGLDACVRSPSRCRRKGARRNAGRRHYVVKPKMHVREVHSPTTCSTASKKCCLAGAHVKMGVMDEEGEPAPTCRPASRCPPPHRVNQHRLLDRTGDEIHTGMKRAGADEGSRESPAVDPRYEKSKCDLSCMGLRPRADRRAWGHSRSHGRHEEDEDRHTQAGANTAWASPTAASRCMPCLPPRDVAAVQAAWRAKRAGIERC